MKREELEIVYFHWALDQTSGIRRSFAPLIEQMKGVAKVREYSVPHFGSNPLHLLHNLLFVLRRRTRTGINHVTGDIHYCLLALIGCRSVLTMHDDYAIRTAKNSIDRALKYLFWIWLPLKIADRVLCISPQTKAQIDHLAKNQKTQVLSQNALCADFCATPRRTTPKPVVLHLGTARNKNAETTIRAVAGLDVRLVICRPMTDAQHALAKELKLDYENRTDMTDDEVVELYRDAAVVSAPSLFEGFGMPIIEAQATGRPVVTTNREPMRWVAGRGALLLDDPKSADELREIIRRLLTDTTLYAEVAEQGLRNAERFQPQTIARQFIELYSQM